LTLVGVGLVVALAFAAHYDAALLLGGLTASLATVALVFQHTLSIPLATDLRLGVLTGLELTRQALLTGGLVLLAVVGADIFGLLSVALVVNLILIAPTVVLVRDRLHAKPALRPTSWLPLLRVTVAFSLATAVGTIYVYTAQILTSLVTTHHQSGLFAISFRVFVVSASVPGVLVGATLPLLARAARDDHARLAYSLQRIFEILLIGGVGAALTLCAGSSFVIAVVAGPQYAAAAPVLAIQSAAMVGSFLVAVWSFGLLSLHRHRGLLVSNLVALSISAALTLVLAHSDGARGAAIATICGETVLAGANLLALVRGHPAYRPNTSIVAKVAVAAALASVPA
ncbi:MAG: polysaccharide biosynthesis C-terminal domain-containing protein, partial [Trebonia sp.]